MTKKYTLEEIALIAGRQLKSFTPEQLVKLLEKAVKEEQKPQWPSDGDIYLDVWGDDEFDAALKAQGNIFRTQKEAEIDMCLPFMHKWELKQVEDVSFRDIPYSYRIKQTHFKYRCKKCDAVKTKKVEGHYADLFKEVNK